MKVGVSDFFFAEIQEGLEEGEVVSLELPKEEREKKAKQLAGQRSAGGEAATRRADRRAGERTRTSLGTASTAAPHRQRRRGQQPDGGGAPAALS